MSANGYFSRIGTILSLCVVLGTLFSFDNELSPMAWAQVPSSNWNGVLRTNGSLPANEGTVLLDSGTNHYSAAVDTEGAFSFRNLNSGLYSVTVLAVGNLYRCPTQVSIPSAAIGVTLKLGRDGSVEMTSTEIGRVVDTDQLTNKGVSEIPLNKRDFSQILLLAAGTSSDTNGASNFTQQFAINGQRGVEATFSLDGADISDPEMGGGTFTNFNVDAILDLKSSSGVMPAEIGRGASGYTDILTRSGTSDLHGSFFEFLRNSALDARNYFDHPSPVSPGRIPPFRRNEFGFTNGGPIPVSRWIGNGKQIFYFIEYQGFRQVLGTTQVLSVPTAEQRSGMDTTAFPGDTLFVPVNSSISQILARYPLPNYPAGTFGANTYATSSKVNTDADQFSGRLDFQSGAKDHWMARFSLDNLSGPTTNPDQTVIDPSFGVEYVDHQRNGVLTWIHTASANLVFESSLSAIRTTPSFPTSNTTDPAVKFNDALFEPFNAPGGSVSRDYGNLFQARENVTFARHSHTVKVGAEIRLNRDSGYFGSSPNGEYDFGGGTAYSAVKITSASGSHTINIGDPLPDTLSAFLTGSAFAYTRAVAPSYFSNGQNIGATAVNRTAIAAYAQDTWKATSRLTIGYGMRFELYTPISDRANRTSGFYPSPGGGQVFLINPEPRYRTRMNNWAPRLQADYRLRPTLVLHAGAAFTTIPPNIWQDNMITGNLPFVFYPRVTAGPTAFVPYGFQFTPAQLPRVYTPDGTDIFANRRPNDVPANTEVDIDRLEQGIADASEGETTPLNVGAISRNFGNAGLGTWSLGLEQSIGQVTLSATYVGTTAYKLPRVAFPNAYPGATAQFAPYTKFNAAGQAVGGFGTEGEMTATSHSSYNALQVSGQGQTPHGGPAFQANYTWSKSIDDASSVGGTSATSTVGAIAQAAPQNPFDTHPERGPSVFDTTNSFSLSLTQSLPIYAIHPLNYVSSKLTRGWQLISISSLSGGTPFTVYTGVQQTGAGSANTDRPDQIAKPSLSTARPKREDYFGRGSDNASFFSIPINVSGGTGPNSGRFGTLGRNTFRGPAYYDYDFSLVKDTPIGRRRSGAELTNLQFRAEFFNLFNIVNMGLPSNTIFGSGFGQINRTNGNSRQIQFSLKLEY
ncbi:hypothetical protein [Tunturiibacter gelidoferens]|uniref:TonB-dependent transporter Oar-like beta-barrel domain-containing protein n=1 Tax=Tunturiibacter gelidiferens TaxID=3069689 RepID=A0A9X0QAJ6_9BACT|nr:hypothetical protein [Edaphobacter lichenicola]MBB5326728.1 hypothetical protein [Edaphobacter lichenicola]